MSDELLQFIIVVGFGAHLTAFIVTRTRFRNQMIKRGAAHYDSEIEILNAAPLPATSIWLDPREGHRRRRKHADN